MWRLRGRTFIPPSFADAEIFAIGCFGYDAISLVALRDGVFCLSRAFFDELLADAVGNVGFCDGGGAFVDFGGELYGRGDGFWFVRIGRSLFRWSSCCRRSVCR